jgi:hypothetical protein
MKTREKTARFVERQFDESGGNYKCRLNKTGAWHYGKQEVQGRKLRNGRRA